MFLKKITSVEISNTYGSSVVAGLVRMAGIFVALFWLLSGGVIFTQTLTYPNSYITVATILMSKNIVQGGRGRGGMMVV